MKIGYCRTSTKNQRLDRQLIALEALCDKLYTERFSAASVKNRPVFDKVLKGLRTEDVLVILDLDRAFRSAEDAIVHERLLRERGVKINVINGAIDTSTADGNRDFQNRAVNAEWERRKISERTIEGLRAARMRGQRLGAEPKMSDCELRTAKSMIEAGEVSITEIALLYDLQPWSVTRAIRRWEQNAQN